ncbi:hypothetical protein [Aliamphritea spongicola]|nr:hypothetical protein [Aliamphritea spongicola]
MSLFSPANDSLNVVILLMPDSSLMSLASTLDTMRAANRISRRTLFSWRVITLDGEPAVLSCGQPIHPQGSMQWTMADTELQRDLLICIAAFHHEKHMDKQRLAGFRQFARGFSYVGGWNPAAGCWQGPGCWKERVPPRTGKTWRISGTVIQGSRYARTAMWWMAVFLPPVGRHRPSTLFFI